MKEDQKINPLELDEIKVNVDKENANDSLKYEN